MRRKNNYDFMFMATYHALNLNIGILQLHIKQLHIQNN